MANLTEKQKRFVEEYLIDLNATQAAIRAGYSVKTANEQGARLLANVSIRAYIESRMAELSKRTGVNQERIIRELARIAFVDPTDVVDMDTATLKPRVTKDDTAAIASVKVKTIPTADEGGVDRVFKKFCPWLGCKELISIDKKYCVKHIQMYEQRQNDRQKIYDRDIRHGRDKQFHDFYNSPEWEQMKVYITNKYHGLCVYSYFVCERILKADAIHHIVELKEDWSKRLDIDNLIPLSAKVHNRMRDMYKADKEGTQNMLRGLIKRWECEMGQG